MWNQQGLPSCIVISLGVVDPLPTAMLYERVWGITLAVEFLKQHLIMFIQAYLGNTVESLNNGHFGTNINSSGLSPL